MRITSISINLSASANPYNYPAVPGESKNLLAYVNVIFDDVFKVRGLRVVVKPTGERMVMMPSRATRTGEYKDVCHPLTQEFRCELERIVLEELAKKLEQVVV